MLRAFLVGAALVASLLVAVPGASAGTCPHTEATLERVVGGEWQVSDAVCLEPDSPYCGGRTALYFLDSGMCTPLP